MTVTQLKDTLEAMYLRECRNRNIPEYTLGDGEFLLIYNLIKSELYEKLNIEYPSATINITPVAVFTEYALPIGFAGLKGLELTIGNQTFSELTPVPIEKATTQGLLEAGTPNSISIYAKSDGLYYAYLYPLCASAGTLVVRYKKVFELNAGTVSSSTIDVPTLYQPLLLEGMMAQLFPDRTSFYYDKLQNALYDRPIPNNGGLAYNMGGIEDEEE